MSCARMQHAVAGSTCCCCCCSRGGPACHADVVRTKFYNHTTSLRSRAVQRIHVGKCTIKNTIDMQPNLRNACSCSCRQRLCEHGLFCETRMCTSTAKSAVQAAGVLTDSDPSRPLQHTAISAERSQPSRGETLPTLTAQCQTTKDVVQPRSSALYRLSRLLMGLLPSWQAGLLSKPLATNRDHGRLVGTLAVVHAAPSCHCCCRYAQRQTAKHVRQATACSTG